MQPVESRRRHRRQANAGLRVDEKCGAHRLHDGDDERRAPVLETSEVTSPDKELDQHGDLRQRHDGWIGKAAWFRRGSKRRKKSSRGKDKTRCAVYVLPEAPGDVD